MRETSALTCEPALWHGRRAYVLENESIRLVTLTGGGHIAELRFLDGKGPSTLNPLWVPPWKTIEPYRYREKTHAARYGTTTTGKMLSGIAGHNLCLDYFGSPSPEEARQGLSIHGEAPSLKWSKLSARVSRQEVSLVLGVRLPQARLRFSRRISMRHGESVVHFTESVVNEAKMDHFFHWTQHVTLGPRFLDPRHSRVFVSGRRGRTSPGGYEGRELLDSGRDFTWPQAPGANRQTVDLSVPLSRTGRGFVATVLLDPRRREQYVAALNSRERLLIGYCFSGRDFPWVANWEENKARRQAPWEGRTQARGLEFGSTPFAEGRHEAFANGPLFGVPHFTSIPARGRITARYVAFLAEVPNGFREVHDIRVQPGEIVITGLRAGDSSTAIAVPADRLSTLG